MDWGFGTPPLTPEETQGCCYISSELLHLKVENRFLKKKVKDQEILIEKLSKSLKIEFEEGLLGEPQVCGTTLHHGNGGQGGGHIGDREVKYRPVCGTTPQGGVHGGVEADQPSLGITRSLNDDDLNTPHHENLFGEQQGGGLGGDREVKYRVGCGTTPQGGVHGGEKADQPSLGITMSLNDDDLNTPYHENLFGEQQGGVLVGDREVKYRPVCGTIPHHGQDGGHGGEIDVKYRPLDINDIWGIANSGDGSSACATCPCGKAYISDLIDINSSSGIIPLCGEVCGKLLGCQPDHACQQTCHPDSCPPCPYILLKRCKCSKTKVYTGCGTKVEDCKKVCQKLLPCGEHRYLRHYKFIQDLQFWSEQSACDSAGVAIVLGIIFLSSQAVLPFYQK